MAARNGTVLLDGTQMDYIRFGTGLKTLVILPGLGDGLRTVKGTALPMSLMYRALAKDYTVWAFSRLSRLPEGCTTRDMARDQAKTMELLGIQKADLLGVSMGGMIAQHLAADHPEKVGKLVLAVTSARPNPLLREAVGEWMELAGQGDHTAFMESNLRRIYSKDYYRKNKWMLPLLGKLTKPKSYDRFLLQAQACCGHDAWERLPKITAPTLVLGGEKDNCLGAESSREMAARIPGAELKIYEQWGHGLYEEEKDFQKTVLAFLRR